jgi:hypothetical protein
MGTGGFYPRPFLAPQRTIKCLPIPGRSDSQFEINSSRCGIVRIRMIDYPKSEIVVQLDRVIHLRQGIAVRCSISEKARPFDNPHHESACDASPAKLRTNVEALQFASIAIQRPEGNRACRGTIEKSYCQRPSGNTIFTGQGPQFILKALKVARQTKALSIFHPQGLNGLNGFRIVRHPDTQHRANLVVNHRTDSINARCRDIDHR